MNKDFRLAVDVADHHKMAKAVLVLGEAVFRCIVRLYGWVARNRPDGILRNMDDADIAVVARWLGDANQFCQTLSDVRLIERSDGDQWYAIHDWSTHNPWAAEANGRSQHAKALNHQRWHVEQGRIEPSCSLCSSLTDSDVTQSGIRTESDTESSLRIVSLRNKESLPGGIFPKGSIELELSELLLSLIRRRNPNHKAPDLQKWARQVDLMIRCDGRSTEEIRRVIEWAQASDFWQNNILSTEKLRTQFDQLVLKSREHVVTTRAKPSHTYDGLGPEAAEGMALVEKRQQQKAGGAS